MQTNRSSRAFLLAAVVLGVLATVAAFVFLDRSSGQDRGPTVKVLVARHDLRPNSPIDPEKDLDELEIPARLTELKSRCLSPEYRTAYKGQRVNRRVLAGTPVMSADLVTVADLELKGDKRALSIPVRGANALSGLLVPGDYVKLMVTRPIVKPRLAIGTNTRSSTPPANTNPPNNTTPPDDNADDAVTQDDAAADSPLSWDSRPISDQAFRVLAVGPSLSRSRQQFTLADAQESMGRMESQQTVTLEVSEAQAKTILQMSGAGQLPVTLILCPPPAK